MIFGAGGRAPFGLRGRLKSKDVKIYDVMLLEGSPYRRLAARDDRPLRPGDEKKEQEKLARNIADRRKRPQRSGRFAWPSTRVVPSGNAKPGTSCRRLSTSVWLGTRGGWQQHVRDRSHIAPGIPAPVPHGKHACAPPGQALGGQAGLALGESGGGSGRHHLSGTVSGPPGQGFARPLSRPG